MRLVLTGGPAGGKSAFLQMAKGILPFVGRVVPEAATAIKGAAPAGGARPRSSDRAFQLAVMRAQLETERALELTPTIDSGGPAAILFDRGLFDSAGFVEPAEYTSLLRALGLLSADTLLRYDAVVFVRSCVPALGTTAARRRFVKESAFEAHAAEVESKLWRVVGEHPNVVVVDALPDFAAKCAAMADAVSQAFKLAQVRPLLPPSG